MLCRKKEFKTGDSVVVTHCWGGYRLPLDLPDGAVVEVIDREPGLVFVAYQGKRHVVSIANVESGWEYRLNGKWRDGNDPLVAEGIQGSQTDKAQRNQVTVKLGR